MGVYKRQVTGASPYFYELTDHLGNVRAVVSKETNETVAIKEATDYYPGGMAMPNRNIVGDYRYGFQGEYAEKEPELGEGKNSFQLRLWDSRIRRWLSPDPYGQYHSPYLGMGNRPNELVDPDGGCTDDKGNPCAYTNGNATDFAGNSWSMVDGTETLNTPIALDEVVIGGSGGSGITAMDVTRTIADFIPEVGAIWDITEGVQNGNGWQVAAGVGFLVLDVATLGGSSLVKGAVKTGAKASLRSLRRKAVRQLGSKKKLL